MKGHIFCPLKALTGFSLEEPWSGRREGPEIDAGVSHFTHEAVGDYGNYHEHFLQEVTLV